MIITVSAVDFLDPYLDPHLNKLLCSSRYVVKIPSNVSNNVQKNPDCPIISNQIWESESKDTTDIVKNDSALNNDKNVCECTNLSPSLIGNNLTNNI